MKYDFETLNTGLAVSPWAVEKGITDPRTVAFSVAEMRLNLAPEITAAMHRCVDVGSFGYATPEPERYNKAVTAWMEKRHNWKVGMDACCCTGGVVVAMGIAIRALTMPGDGVIIMTPVYPPFSRQVTGNNRTLLESPLICRDGRYEMDFDDLEEKAKQAKLLMLCSPHNPVGRVWTEEELRKLGDICLRNHLYVLSDEIHFDLDFAHRHQVLTCAVPALRDHAIICTAPSKTFNLAGNSLSNIFIEDAELKKRFDEELARSCGHYIGTFAFMSATAAYESGEAWLEELLQHLQHNRDVLETRMKKLIPGAVFSPLEGTYLQWIDLSCLGLNAEGLTALMDKAQLVVNDGPSFGHGGEGHIRFNLACPTVCIEEAMDRLEKAL